MARVHAPPMLGEGLVSRRLVVSAPDAILVKAVIEAHEGVATLFGEKGGDLTLAAPSDRHLELDELMLSVDELIRASRRNLSRTP
ncbi:MAG: hypothetical protein NVS3B20_26870 [Polyangiales bacterium]